LFAHFDVVGWETATTREERIRCLDAVYCCLNVRRLEAINAGDVSYLGVIAKALIRLSEGSPMQTIRSAGLWGIESDSSPEYFAEVEAEELEALRSELECIGFSSSAIDAAFAARSRPED
jgi:hypothetical protein